MRLSRSTITVSWGRTPPVWGRWPASRLRRASSVRASARRWLPLRWSSALAGRARGSRAEDQGLASLGLQEAVHRDHVVQGGGQPKASLLVAAFGPAGRGVGVGDSAKVGDHLSQAWRIQAAGRLQQDQFGLGSGVGGELPGAVGQDRGVGGRQFPSAKAWAV